MGNYPLVNQHNYEKSQYLMGTVNQLFLRAIFNSYVKLPEGIKYQTAMRAMKVSNRLKMLDSGDYCTELFKK